MNKAIRLDDEAAEELEAAMEWYEARRSGLGSELVAATREALRRVQARPKAWSLVPGVPPELNVRRCLLRRFPYAVVYIEVESEIRVLAIAHGSRQPGYWRPRT